MPYDCLTTSAEEPDVHFFNIDTASRPFEENTLLSVIHPLLAVELEPTGISPT